MKRESNKTWKFGIIGSGMISNYHAKAIQAIPNAVLSSIFGRNEVKVIELSKRYNCNHYLDFDQFLSADIDIVTIATPSGAHLEPAIKAAAAGKHIISEKPLEVTTERIDRMINTCDDHGVLLSGIFNRRFNNGVKYLKKAIDDQRFGILTLADAQIRWFRDQAYYDSGVWRGTIDLDGGGALMNQSIHTIDLLLYFMGPVKRLSATMDCLTHSSIEVEDTAVAILEFKNGARGSIQGSTSCWSQMGHPAEINICGEKGSVFMRDEKFMKWEFELSATYDENVKSLMSDIGGQGLGANDPGAINFQGHIHNFENVINTLEGNAELLITGAEARKSVELINAIYYSARNSGIWVHL